MNNISINNILYPILNYFYTLITNRKILISFNILTLLYIICNLILPEHFPNFIFQQFHLINIKNSFNINLLIFIFAFIGIIFNLLSLKSSEGRLEIFCSLFYIISAIILISVNDISQVVVAWEFMSLSSIIMVIANIGRNFLKITANYIFLHILSGSLMLLAPILINFSGAYNSLIMQILFITLFAGIFINIAIPPFSCWMANTYSNISNNLFLLMFSITSKASIIIFLELGIFANNYIHPLFLYYTGIFTIIFAGIYAMIENCIKRYLVYASLISTGFILVLCSYNNKILNEIITLYVIGSILYNTCMVLLINHICINGETRISKLKGYVTANKIIMILFIILGAMLISVPGTYFYYIKYLIHDVVGNNIKHLDYIIYLVFTLQIFSYPWDLLQKSNKNITIKNNYFIIGIIILVILSTFYINFPGNLIIKNLGLDINPYHNTAYIKYLQPIILLIFYIILHKLVIRKKHTYPEFNNLYNITISKILVKVEEDLFHLYDKFIKLFFAFTKKIWKMTKFIHGDNGIIERKVSIGSSLTWIVVMLLISLVIFYTE